MISSRVRPILHVRSFFDTSFRRVNHKYTVFIKMNAIIRREFRNYFFNEMLENNEPSLSFIRTNVIMYLESLPAV
jgi:hypothetical protein